MDIVIGEKQQKYAKTVAIVLKETVGISAHTADSIMVNGRRVLNKLKGGESMMDIKKIIKGMETHTGLFSECRDGCPYFREDGSLCSELHKDALAMLKAQDEIINELLKVGYPHGYEKEEPWIIDYMQLITEVMKKAVRLRNGTE